MNWTSCKSPAETPGLRWMMAAGLGASTTSKFWSMRTSSVHLKVTVTILLLSQTNILYSLSVSVNPVSFLGDQMESSVTEQPKKRGRPKGGRNKPKQPCEALTNNGRNLAQSLGQCLRCSRGQADQVQATTMFVCLS